MCVCECVCVCVCVCVFINVCTPTHRCENTHLLARKHTHTPTHSYTHTLSHTPIHTWLHACSHKYIHTLTNKHARTHAHTFTETLLPRSRLRCSWSALRVPWLGRCDFSSNRRLKKLFFFFEIHVFFSKTFRGRTRFARVETVPEGFFRANSANPPKKKNEKENKFSLNMATVHIVAAELQHSLSLSSFRILEIWVEEFVRISKCSRILKE